jgi:hypothetical protein
MVSALFSHVSEKDNGTIPLGSRQETHPKIIPCLMKCHDFFPEWNLLVQVLVLNRPRMHWGRDRYMYFPILDAPVGIPLNVQHDPFTVICPNVRMPHLEYPLGSL